MASRMVKSSIMTRSKTKISLMMIKNLRQTMILGLRGFNRTNKLINKRELVRP